MNKEKEIRENRYSITEYEWMKIQKRIEEMEND